MHVAELLDFLDEGAALLEAHARLLTISRFWAIVWWGEYRDTYTWWVLAEGHCNPTASSRQ